MCKYRYVYYSACGHQELTLFDYCEAARRIVSFPSHWPTSSHFDPSYEASSPLEGVELLDFSDFSSLNLTTSLDSFSGSTASTRELHPHRERDFDWINSQLPSMETSSKPELTSSWVDAAMCQNPRVQTDTHPDVHTNYHFDLSDPTAMPMQERCDGDGQNLDITVSFGFGMDTCSGFTTELIHNDGKVKEIVARFESGLPNRGESRESPSDEARVCTDDLEEVPISGSTCVGLFTVPNPKDLENEAVSFESFPPLRSSANSMTSPRDSNCSRPQGNGKVRSASWAQIAAGHIEESQEHTKFSQSHYNCEHSTESPSTSSLGEAIVKNTEATMSENATLNFGDIDLSPAMTERPGPNSPRKPIPSHWLPKSKAPMLKTAQRAADRETRKKGSPSDSIKDCAFKTVRGRRDTVEARKDPASDTATFLTKEAAEPVDGDLSAKTHVLSSRLRSAPSKAALKSSSCSPARENKKPLYTYKTTVSPARSPLHIKPKEAEKGASTRNLEPGNGDSGRTSPAETAYNTALPSPHTESAESSTSLPSNLTEKSRIVPCTLLGRERCKTKRAGVPQLAPLKIPPSKSAFGLESKSPNLTSSDGGSITSSPASPSRIPRMTFKFTHKGASAASSPGNSTRRTANPLKHREMTNSLSNTKRDSHSEEALAVKIHRQPPEALDKHLPSTEAFINPTEHVEVSVVAIGVREEPSEAEKIFKRNLHENGTVGLCPHTGGTEATGAIESPSNSAGTTRIFSHANPDKTASVNLNPSNAVGDSIETVLSSGELLRFRLQPAAISFASTSGKPSQLEGQPKHVAQQETMESTASNALSSRTALEADSMPLPPVLTSDVLEVASSIPRYAGTSDNEEWIPAARVTAKREEESKAPVEDETGPSILEMPFVDPAIIISGTRSAHPEQTESTAFSQNIPNSFSMSPNQNNFTSAEDSIAGTTDTTSICSTSKVASISMDLNSQKRSASIWKKTSPTRGRQQQSEATVASLSTLNVSPDSTRASDLRATAPAFIPMKTDVSPTRPALPVEWSHDLYQYNYSMIDPLSYAMYQPIMEPNQVSCPTSPRRSPTRKAKKSNMKNKNKKFQTIGDNVEPPPSSNGQLVNKDTPLEAALSSETCAAPAMAIEGQTFNLPTAPRDHGALISHSEVHQGSEYKNWTETSMPFVKQLNEISLQSAGRHRDQSEGSTSYQDWYARSTADPVPRKSPPRGTYSSYNKYATARRNQRGAFRQAANGLYSGPGSNMNRCTPSNAVPLSSTVPFPNPVPPPYGSNLSFTHSNNGGPTEYLGYSYVVSQPCGNYEVEMATEYGGGICQKCSP
ncbi:hypothetical protein K432DRAFT_183191 [Lepidopterella palustris CBS 459.81]|uniref:Uncharacterized protein n=1 Tax=Lepidopterella palustris CBS 459.81 TaxID=1314670 RepID=A0A8E2JIK8_9PEZI|nr:hypothetical protein K432DRAFT_183191 [Lepidopterella palustris CBS 459.81]